MEVGIFTKGTRDYAEDILKQVKNDFSLKYPDLASKFDSILKIRLYRENLNSEFKDLELISNKHKINIDNILLVDNLMTNFTH